MWNPLGNATRECESTVDQSDIRGLVTPQVNDSSRGAASV